MTALARLKHFLTPFDARYEAMTRAGWKQVAWRDVSAGLIVAMMAIPMAMGFAMAAGLRPEHGIFAGAIAGLVGGLFGGSKYNTYGPVAALIPVVAGIMASRATPADPYAGHGFIVLVCIASAPILLLFAAVGWGKVGNLVPHSIVVGFSVGIAVVIGVSQLGEILGLKATVRGNLVPMLSTVWQHLGEVNLAALFIAALVFLITRYALKISTYLPAPLIAVGVATLLSHTVLKGAGLTVIKAKYGAIPRGIPPISWPAAPTWDTAGEIVYYALAFAFVCGFESLLCARMADRAARNAGTPYDPDKEFFGQGLILAFVPLLSGMPLSGALARTSTKIQVGGVTPLAELSKSILKLLLVFFLSRYLEMVPMACIGGLLLWVAFGMVKPAEMKEIWTQSAVHRFLMIYTAVTVVVLGFLPGVISAMVIYGVLVRALPQKERVEAIAAETEDEPVGPALPDSSPAE